MDFKLTFILIVFIAICSSKVIDKSKKGGNEDSASDQSEQVTNDALDIEERIKWIIKIKKAKIHRHEEWVPPQKNRSKANWLSNYGATSGVVYDTVLKLVRICKKLIITQHILSLPEKYENITITDVDIEQLDIFLFGSIPTVEQANRCILDNNGSMADIIPVTMKYRQHLRKMNKDKYYGNANQWKKNKGGAKSRGKRSFTKSTKLWSLPIPYKYDGTHNSDDHVMIDAAFAAWERETCVRFREMEISEQSSKQHVLLTSQRMCYSYVGEAPTTDNLPQQLNLNTKTCTSSLGIAVHEIGHTLGLKHEHTRFDRDTFLYINFLSVYPWYYDKFGKSQNIPELSMNDYDYNSIMHYGPKDFSFSDLYNSIYTNDWLYSGNIGQRMQISFLDAKKINNAYCKDACLNHPKRASCANGGYPDPNNCTKCKCPDGLGGYRCLNTKNVNIGCQVGGTLYASTAVEKCVSTTNFGHAYNHGDMCNFKIRATVGYKVRVRFVEQFGIYKEGQICYHWIEIKTKADASLPGPRICGHRIPYFNHGYLQSETSQLFINFNAQYPTVSNNYTQTVNLNGQVGFKLCYIAV